MSESQQEITTPPTIDSLRVKKRPTMAEIAKQTKRFLENMTSDESDNVSEIPTSTTPSKETNPPVKRD